MARFKPLPMPAGSAAYLAAWEDWMRQGAHDAPTFAKDLKDFHLAELLAGSRTEAATCAPSPTSGSARASRPSPA